MNPKLGATDAVTLPLEINAISNDNAERGISYKNLPLPLNDEPVSKNIPPPLINNEPVNLEPNSADSTLKPTPSGFTDAVTLPLEIRFDTSDGTFLKLLPSPKNEPDIIDALTANDFTLPLTSIEPVN